MKIERKQRKNNREKDKTIITRNHITITLEQLNTKHNPEEKETH